MNKRVLMLVIGALILGLGGGGAYLYLSRNTNAAVTGGLAETTVSPTPAPKMKSWDDPAGFMLEYPEVLTVNKHDEDKENYAHLEFTDPAHPGNIIVWVKDLPKGISSTASWAKKTATGSAITFDTTLGENPAQKILFSSPAKSEQVGIVYDGLLWYAEGNFTDETYWQPVFEGIATSFAFKPIPAAESGAGGGADTGTNDATFDEEEVLE